MLRKIMFALLGALAAVFTVAAGLTLGQDSADSPVGLTCESIRGSSEGTAGADLRSGMFIYRLPLGPDGPAGFVKYHPVIARVTIKSAGEAACGNSPDGAPLVSTSYVAEVTEYIKGEGPSELRLGVWGGTIAGLTSEVSGIVGPDDLTAGDDVIVFTSGPAEWRIGDAYVFDGSTARGVVHNYEMPVEDLLSQLREAAAAEASAQ